MNLADRLTASRMIMSPAFFALFIWGGAWGLSEPFRALVLVLLFTVIEVSDLLDGMVARGQKTVSAFGKLFDPFADVFARMTYFFCFAIEGLMPQWAFLLILYREFCQLFLRMLLAERGIAMAARPGGKLKAVFYMIAGAVSLAVWSWPRLGLPELPSAPAGFVVTGLYVVAVALSLGSFADYLVQFRKLTKA